MPFSFDSLVASIGITPAMLGEAILKLAPELVAVSLILLAWSVFFFVTSRILAKTLGQTKLRPALIEIAIHSIYKWVTFLFALVLALSQVGIDVTAAVAGLGIAGIALGFAAKETLSNILAGFNIFIDDLYRRGDWVEIGEKYGEVRRITLRTTKIRNLDNIFVIIPNSEVTLNPVTNFSEEGMIRFSVSITIDYRESISKARSVLLEAIGGMDDILKDPEPEVVAEEFGESGVKLLVRVWIEKPGKQPKIKFTLTEVCKDAFDAAGICIPYPQRVVHMQ